MARDPRLVAPDLLGLVLRTGLGTGRIVEVEAYCGADDPAAHTYRGPTARTATMYGVAGLLYVYRSYGLHWCANIVCGEPGEGVAVLVRALQPRAGVDAMRAARTAGRRAGAAPMADRDLCRGPGRLCQALGITGADDGVDLVTGADGLRLEDDGWRPPAVEQGVRVGISVAVDRPWRWWVRGAPEVSRGRQAADLSAGRHDGVASQGPHGGQPGSLPPELTSKRRRG